MPTSQLKTHLSRYLRELQDGGEPIEVCVREETVAYLTPAKGGVGPDEPSLDREIKLLEENLRAAGLRLDAASWRRNWQGRQDAPMVDPPPAAGDGRTDINTVAQMRQGRPW